MTPPPLKSEAWRRSARSLVLLGLLGVCVAVAWVLVQHEGGPAREAIDILAEVRKAGLAEYWKEKTEKRQWFLLRRGGKIVGWQMTSRRPDDSGFSGSMVRKTIDQQIQVKWELSDDLRHGTYESQAVSSISLGGRRPGVQTVRAVLVLEGSHIKVQQNVGGNVFQSSGRTPDNYLPEGMGELALQIVSMREAHARFSMILDNASPKVKTPRFFTWDVRYVGPSELSRGASTVETTLLGLRDPDSHITVLDAEGNIIRQMIGGTEIQAVTGKDVLKIFPNAASVAGDTVEI
jgi:hypothetical protein